jgi:hypothetical protein
MLRESLDAFIEPIYSKTKRTNDTYRTVAAHCRDHLVPLVSEYLQTKNDQQKLRELRNDMDYYLRRYHKYCIEERLNRTDAKGAHYHEIGADDSTDFEHLIPAARIRDLMIKGAITVEQALNAPTVQLSRDKHMALKDAGWASRTPDMWLPFRRYSQVFSATFQTYDGTGIDPETWTLERHFEYFRHLAL